MRCEHCGYEQAAGRFCDQCGRMLTRVRMPDAQAGQKDGNPIPSAPLRCPGCGHEQGAGRVCESCGLVIDVVRKSRPKDGEPAEIRCQECGMVATGSLCRNCGVRVTAWNSGE